MKTPRDMVSLLHLRHQRKNLATLSGIALGSIFPRPRKCPEAPGPLHSTTVSPLPQTLRDDFVHWCGGNPAKWEHEVSPWLFPQWGLPVLAKTLNDIPWQLTRVVNQGCRVEWNGPLPAGAPLTVSAQLMDLEVTERRARMHQRLCTGPLDHPDALVADVFAVVSLSHGKGKTREPPRVPSDHLRLTGLRAEPHDGRRFALLTGDFNPIHWVGPYAKLAGFGGVILHGFGTMARAGQALLDSWLDGDKRALQSLDVRFVRPLRIPSEVSLFCDTTNEHTVRLSVGQAPGETARMLGTATRRTP